MGDSSRPQQLIQKDLWGKALLDYYHKKPDQLTLHTSYGDPELVSLEIFFRDPDMFSELEVFACQLCKGKVLDIGAGAGCHTLALQNQGFQVTALEKSPGACEVLKLLGVRQVIEGDIYQFNETGFDTALLMMNGLGLAGSLNNLPNLLSTLFSCLVPSGQIIADSSDISYLYGNVPPPSSSYYGEVEYFYEYRGNMDDTFPWLFVDFKRLQQAATTVGLMAQLVYEEEDQYLVRITKL